MMATNRAKMNVWAVPVAALMLSSWMGLFASWRSTFSCDLVAVQYPAGGVHLTVKAVGIWSYQKEVSDDLKGSAIVCVDYGVTLAQQPELKNILPSSKTLQVYSILASSFYFAAFLAVVIFILKLPMHPEALNQIEGVQYPIGGKTATLASFFFTNAAIIHIISLHGLIHNNVNSTYDQSPICNPTYSHCKLGPGGRWAVFAIANAFFCKLVLLLAAFYVGRMVRQGETHDSVGDMSPIPLLRC